MCMHVCMCNCLDCKVLGLSVFVVVEYLLCSLVMILYLTKGIAKTSIVVDKSWT